MCWLSALLGEGHSQQAQEGGCREHRKPREVGEKCSCPWYGGAANGPFIHARAGLLREGSCLLTDTATPHTLV